ncbi:hypothetical protein CEXT_71151 [Caerostris extrusa]|uniref:Uncharacterized protein n=1 Tax=Caerostris extrusa TaxID=172846 RepID=A0AAV4Y7U1_CAEEX|nr:hypothetical protein CEXT_71151 [Caerostris extrusa]
MLHHKLLNVNLLTRECCRVQSQRRHAYRATGNSCTPDAEPHEGLTDNKICVIAENSVFRDALADCCPQTTPLSFCPRFAVAVCRKV